MAELVNRNVMLGKIDVDPGDDWYSIAEHKFADFIGNDPVLLDQYLRERGGSNPRSPTDPDHHWHSDRSHLPISHIPDFTLLYGHETTCEAAPFQCLTRVVCLKRF